MPAKPFRDPLLLRISTHRSTALLISAGLGIFTSGCASPALIVSSPSVQLPTPSIAVASAPPTATLLASPAPQTGLAEGTFPLAQVLGWLPVSPEAGVGYSRALFPLWIDADHDGCNTRKEVLLRDASTEPFKAPHCLLIGGVWISPYDGSRLITTLHVEIDHVVALAEAWKSGASSWDSARREAYANDLDVPWTLLAVSAAANLSKGDRDPAEWLPPRTDFLCSYLSDWVAVKARWALTVDQSERDSIALHDECAQTPVTVEIAP